jgi:hypothetical protein
VTAEGAKAIADSTHGTDTLNEIGTVVADPTPTWYSLHPLTEVQVPTRVYPEPAVDVVEPPSVFPMTTELRPGVIDGTDELDRLVEELPVDVTGLVVDTPLIS